MAVRANRFGAGCSGWWVARLVAEVCGCWIGFLVWVRRWVFGMVVHALSLLVRWLIFLCRRGARGVHNGSCAHFETRLFTPVLRKRESHQRQPCPGDFHHLRMKFPSSAHRQQAATKRLRYQATGASAWNNFSHSDSNGVTPCTFPLAPNAFKPPSTWSSTPRSSPGSSCSPRRAVAATMPNPPQPPRLPGQRTEPTPQRPRPGADDRLPTCRAVQPGPGHRRAKPTGIRYRNPRRHRADIIR